MFGSRIINRCRSAVLMMNGGLNIGTPVRWSTTVIKMPKLMNAANGSLDKWVKNEGDAFDKGEPLAELTLDGITIGLQLKESGILAKRILTEGQVGDVGDAIAIVADTEDTYKQYLADVEAAEQAAAAAEAAKKESPNSINILRHIKHMIQLGILHDESEFVVNLLKLAQSEDKQLMDLFESSYDGDKYNESTFDNHFFIENVDIMLKKLAEEKHDGQSNLNDSKRHDTDKKHASK